MKPNRVLVLFLTFPVVASAQDPASLKRIEKAIEEARQKTFVPGVSVAIVRDDKVVLAKGFGMADVERKRPATSDTIYCIGSSTKAFTGLLVALAAEDGKLSLTDPPSKYLREFRLKDPYADQNIQIIDILTHRSGLPRTDVAWYTGKFTRDEILQMLPEFEPTAKLREKWQYQNVMFMAAGEIAARVAGKSYDDLLRDRILKPLGMDATTVTYEGAAASNQLAQGYAPVGRWTAKSPLPYRSLNAAAPAGAINSNVKDMAQWIRLQLNKGAVDGTVVAKPETIEETHKPRVEMVPGSGSHYGFGWMLRKWNENPLIEHGGNIDGYNALVSFLPEKKVGVVVLTNVSASSLPNQIADAVYRELVGVPEKKEAATGGGGEAAKFKDAGDDEMGSYDLDIAKTTLTFKKENGRVFMEQGPVKVPLKLTADKTYEPDGKGFPQFKLTFRPSEKDPKVPELFLEQSGMKFTLPKQPPYEAPISGEDLLAKSVEAQGGAEAIRKQRHMVTKFTAKMLSDGITIRGLGFSEGGNKSAQFGVFFALNKRFAWVHSLTDGKIAYDGASFTKNDPRAGGSLIDAINEANIEKDLMPKAFYKSLKVTKEEKVGGEDAYVLVKTPKQGSKTSEWISKTTFLPLKRQQGGTTTEYSDYRSVDGLMVSFTQKVQSPESGVQIVTLDSVSFTDPIPHWAFRWNDTK